MMNEPKILESQGRSLAPIIAQAIEAKLLSRIEELTVKVNTLHVENVALNNRQNQLEQEVEALQIRLREQNQRMEDVEIYARAHDIIIRGLPDLGYAQRAAPASSLSSSTSVTSVASHSLIDSNASVESSVLELFTQKLGVVVKKEDISVAHRLKASGTDTVRPSLSDLLHAVSVMMCIELRSN